MLKYIANILTLLTVLVPLYCQAVETYIPKVADPVLEPWRWREVRELGGLGVLSVDEATDGSLWFGCIGGLVRYDGLQVEKIPFEEELLSGIQRNENRNPWAMSVLCLQDGSLLAVVESGLVHWKNGEWKIILSDVGGPSYETRLLQGMDGTVWLLMEDFLWVITEDLSEQYILLTTKGSERMTSFCLDGQGGAWVIRNTKQRTSELIHIPLQDARPENQGTWSTHGLEIRKPGDESSLCIGPAGKVWYVDNNASNGLWIFDPDTASWQPFNQPESQKGYYSLMKDRTGTLWAGGPGLLYTVSAANGRYYSPSRLGLPTIPLSIHETAEGKWWVIGRGGYVYAMDPGDGQWQTYLDLHFECETADGKQWFLTGNRRVVSHDPSTGEWLRYKLNDGLIDWPRSLYASSHGLVWATGSHKGRAATGVFDGQDWKQYEHSDFALYIGEGVLESSDGTMWFGAMGAHLGSPARLVGGVLECKVTSKGKVRVLKHHAADVFPYAVARLSQTPDGLIWLGAPAVHCYDAEAGVTEVVPNLPAVHTQDMAVDGAGSLWVAKGLFGIYQREEDGGWRSFSAEDGLTGKLVVDLLPLQDGSLLAAADTGISRYDGTSWMGNVFNSDFGMSGRSGNMRQSSDGALWFNFSGKDVRSPQVVINTEDRDRFCTVRYLADALAPDTSINSHLEQVDATGNIYLSWSGRDVWDNTPDGRLQFSWRTDQNEWSPYSYETGRTFLNLASGRHTLEVRTRDRDFNIDSTPARSSFSVSFPIWRQAWFIAMVFLMVSGTVVFVWILIYFHEKRLKDRAQHLMEIDQIKTGFFTNISHELRTPLTLISRPLERLLESEDQEDKREMLSMALRNSNRVWNLASQLLDFRKLERGHMQVDWSEGDIAQCVREIIELLQPAARSKQIECMLESPESCMGCFDVDKMKKIVQNLVNNAIKYTPAGGEIRVVLQTARDRDGFEKLTLIVEDNGPGIDPSHMSRIFDRFYRIPEKTIVDGSGIGLNLTKELVELLGGKIQAESPIDPNKEHPGTRFTVCLLIDRNEINSGVESVSD